MFHRYRYEEKYYAALNRLPLDLRRKLDLCGIKLSLKDWLAIALPERIALCDLAVDTADEAKTFSAYLDELARKYCGRPAEKSGPLDSALWDGSAVPVAVLEKSANQGYPRITLEEWRNWRSHERYALFKTATSNNQPEAFEQVLAQLRGQIERRG